MIIEIESQYRGKNISGNSVDESKGVADDMGMSEFRDLSPAPPSQQTERKANLANASQEIKRLKADLKRCAAYVKREFPDERAYSYVDKACLNAHLARMCEIRRQIREWQRYQRRTK